MTDIVDDKGMFGLPGYAELIEHVASKMTGKDLAMFVLSHVQTREKEGKPAGQLIVEEMAKAFDAELTEIRTLRSALAAEREECAKVATSTIFEQVRIPCPDGVDGCLVQHYGPRERGLSPAEIAAAIRARKG